MRPCISVIVPLFNKEPYLERCLASVRAQTLQDLEVIIVDDGSTDGGPALAAGLLTDRDRLIRQANAGPSAARNRAVQESSGDLLAFLDADDTWMDDHLADKVALFERFPEAGLAAGPTRPMRPGESPLAPPKDLLLTDYFAVAASARRHLFQTSSVVMRRSAFDRVGPFAPIPHGQDSELWVRVALVFPIAIAQRVTTEYDQDVPGSVIRVHQERRPVYPPTVATLKERLGAGAVPDRIVSSVRAYCGEWLTDHAIEILRCGDAVEARAVAAEAVGFGARSGVMGIRVASHLPRPLARFAVRAVGRARRANAHVRWPLAGPGLREGGSC